MVDQEKFAVCVSRVLNPVFVLGIVIVLVSFEASGSGTLILLCVLIALFFTVFAPWSVVLYMRRRGEISELFIPRTPRPAAPAFLFLREFLDGCWYSVSDTRAARAVCADGLCRSSGHCRAFDNDAVENQLTRHGALGCMWRGHRAL